MGPLGIRLLLTGDDSNGSVSIFEVLVPGRAEAGGAGRETLETWPGMQHFFQVAVRVFQEAGEALGRVGRWIQDQTV